jgi:Zn-finger nucleic acid-binding protein
MRLIVACSKCRRQYDATGRAPGSRFRCLCGSVLTVQAPEGHEAAVVRCSSCGAPREQQALNCRFCGADFTLHERDLHTVCPKCMARVSDRAQFCHHCGIRLMPESVAGDRTKLTCPVCGQGYRLTNRPIGDVSVLECGRCAGLWLGNETFKELTVRASSASIDVDQLFESMHAGSARPAVVDQPESQRWAYRRCPVCDAMMHRRNYGRRSGVIIDLCKDHGVWFDADELPRILAWIRSGEMAKVKQEEARQEARDERLKRLTRRPERDVVIDPPFGTPHGYPYSPLGSFLGELIAWLIGAR